MEECIFCKIISGEIDSYKFYEDDHFACLLDIFPFFKGHSLVIPKEHHENIEELPQKIASGIIPLAQKVAGVIKQEFNPVGFNFLQNNGEHAGQSVMHYHLHIIPRYKDSPKGGLRHLSNDKLSYKPSEEELQKIAEQLGKQF